MGSCCQKQSSYGDPRSEEPSAWQLATMDDFYDSEASEMHDEAHVVVLNPSGMSTDRYGPRNDDLNLQSDDEQFVSLDFNLAPKLASSFRSSLLRASTTTSGSSFERTEALVLPEIAALNDLRGSGSFTGISTSPAHAKQSNSSNDRTAQSRSSDSLQISEQATDLEGTVVVHNSSSIYPSSSYIDSSIDTTVEKPLGGALSGEDDEDSVASPLVSVTPSTPTKSNGGASTIASVATRSPLTQEKGYVPLTTNEIDDSTVYEDAVSSEHVSVTT